MQFKDERREEKKDNVIEISVERGREREGAETWVFSDGA